MHQDEFQSICRKLSTRKSGTWNDWEFCSQLKWWLNGWTVCYSGKEGSSWFKHWRPFNTEKAPNLPGSKGPEWSFRKGTVLHQVHQGNTWKIPCHDLIYNSQLQQRFLDGGATPRVQKIDNNGIGHWKVPVDKTSNGFHHGTECVPVKTWFNFPQRARSNWDSRWHDHFW